MCGYCYKNDSSGLQIQSRDSAKLLSCLLDQQVLMAPPCGQRQEASSSQRDPQWSVGSQHTVPAQELFLCQIMQQRNNSDAWRKWDAGYAGLLATKQLETPEPLQTFFTPSFNLHEMLYFCTLISSGSLLGSLFWVTRWRWHLRIHISELCGLNLLPQMELNILNYRNKVQLCCLKQDWQGKFSIKFW